MENNNWTPVSSGIFPDDMSGDNTDIVVFNEKDYDKALHLIGRK